MQLFADLEKDLKDTRNGVVVGNYLPNAFVHDSAIRPNVMRIAHYRRLTRRVAELENEKKVRTVLRILTSRIR